jgi:hypothetical protein
MVTGKEEAALGDPKPAFRPGFHHHKVVDAALVAEVSLQAAFPTKRCRLVLLGLPACVDNMVTHPGEVGGANAGAQQAAEATIVGSCSTNGAPSSGF